MRKELAVAIVIVTSLVSVSLARAPQRVRQLSHRLVARKPTVYLTFERTGERQPMFTGESGAGVWLRLHNNFKSPISVRVYDYTENEAGIVYGVERPRLTGPTSVREKAVPQEGYDLPLVVDVDISTVQIIPPGRSLMFSLPQEYLKNGLAVYVPFNYQWETQRGEPKYNEPEHRAYFYSHELPPDVRRRD